MIRNPIELSKLLDQRECDVEVLPDETYRFAGVRSFGGGVFPSTTKLGNQFAYKRLTTLRAGNFVYPKLMAWEGALGVVPASCDGLVVSPEFCVFDVNTKRVVPELLAYYFRSASALRKLAGDSPGTNIRRRRLYPSDFLKFTIPLPPLAEQTKFVRKLFELESRMNEIMRLQQECQTDLEALLPSVLASVFGESAST